MNMRRAQCFPRGVVFFGPDGAGKSTQAQLLVKFLKSQKCRPRMAWIRGRHSFAFFIAKFFTKLGYYRVVKSPNGASYEIFDPCLLPKLGRLWGFIEFASVLPWIFTRVYLPRILGYTVVSERYVVDTVVYLGYWLGKNSLQSFLAKVLLNFIPKDSVLIHLDAETHTLLERHPDDVISRDFIVFQRQAYGMFAESLKAISIDTSTCGIEESFQRIIKHLNATTSRRKSKLQGV